MSIAACHHSNRYGIKIENSIPNKYILQIYNLQSALPLKEVHHTEPF